MSYTKGPWTISCDEVKEGRLVYGPDAHLVADCHNIRVRTKEEEQANARLIAAAPELLEALQELCDLIDDVKSGYYTPDSFTTQPARAVIAKATS